VGCKKRPVVLQNATKYVWIYTKRTQDDNLTSDPPSALLGAGAWGEATLRTIPPPPKARSRAAKHAANMTTKNEYCPSISK
jgi:hypothetical protein